MLKFIQKKASAADGIRDERLRAAFSAAPVALVMAQLDGRCILFNDVAPHFLGYTREELGRVSLQEMTHPEDLPRELGLLKKMVTGEASRYQLDKRVADKQGKYREVNACASLVRRKGDPDAVVYVFTPSQRRAEASSSADGLSNLVLDGLTDVAVMRCDAQGVILGWNRGAEEIFGYEREEILRRNRRLLYRRDDNWSAIAAEHLRVAVERGSIEMEDWRITKDGREVWMRVSLTPSAPGGVIRGFVEVLQPVAQSSAVTEAVVAQLREELERERDAGSTFVRVIEKQKAKRLELEQELAALRKHVERAETSEAAAAEWIPFRRRSALDIIEQMAGEQRTGLLLFTSEGRQKSIHLEEGRIASCASNDDEQSLGERLVREGVITEKQRDEALEMAGQTNVALGRALVLLETLVEEVVVVALRAKLGNELADLETWTSGQWTFVKREPPRDRPVRLSVPVNDARSTR